MHVNELPPEILQKILLPGPVARQAVRVCRLWLLLFTPQLYQVICFEKPNARATSPIDQSRTLQRSNTPTAVLNIPLPEVRISRQRALHLWFHTICSSTRLRRCIRRVYLLSDLTLSAESITDLDGTALSCNGPWCVLYDWAKALSCLPFLEHLSLSPSWMLRIAGLYPRLPKLRTLRTYLPPDTGDDFLVTQGTPPPVWETSHLLQLATQPRMHTMYIAGGKMSEAVEPSPARSSSAVSTLVLDTVMVPGQTLTWFLRCFSQLQRLTWIRPSNTCLPGDQNCGCEGTITQDLERVLTSLGNSLTVLNLEFQTDGQHRWWPWRCPRDRHIVSSLHDLSSVRALRIAAELLVGRRFCGKHARRASFHTTATQHLARKLPAQVEHLTVIVDIAYAIYESGFRSKLLQGIIGDRERLSALREVVILDAVGDAYNDDVCGMCAVHDPFSDPPNLEVDMQRCRDAGISVRYQPCSADQIQRVYELSGVASHGRSLWSSRNVPRGAAFGH